MEILEIVPSGPVRGRVRPPGSKSITNRALVCAALARGTSVLHGALDSDDTRVMVAAWRELGITIESEPPQDVLRVTGGGGSIAPGPKSLYVENSGTTIRFLTAAVALGSGTYRLHGNTRMHQRPIGDLVRALQHLRIDARCDGGNDCPPVTVATDGLVGGVVEVAGDISSQFLSGLLLAAPCARGPIQLRVRPPLISIPYVEMTLRVMESFAASIRRRPESLLFEIDPTGYTANDYAIEPDASAASYFLAAAAATGGVITIDGLGTESLQGDVRFVDCLREMGCAVEARGDTISLKGPGHPDSARSLKGIDADMRDISDTVPSLAVLAAIANGPTRIRGVAHIRHKESDRIGDLARELRKVGAQVDILEDGLRIEPGPLRSARIATYDDHRIAMSFAILGLRSPGIVIENPECTAKTYPNFFQDLDRIRT